MTLATFIFWTLLLGVVATFLAGLLGLGGGVLIIPGLVAIFHAKGIAYSHLMHLALGSSLATVFFISLIAMRAHQKQIKIRWKIVGYMVPGLIAGSLFGSWLASILATDWLMIIFGTFLAYVGLKFLFAKNGQDKGRPLSEPILLFFGAIVGVLAALMGLGGGVFIVPMLKRYIAEMREVIALSTVCLVPVSFIATIAYMVLGWNKAGLPAHSFGYVYWPAVIPLVAMAMIFTPLGVKLVHRLPQQLIKYIFGAFICIISISMFYTVFVGH
jgi:hypothetical protein